MIKLVFYNSYYDYCDIWERYIPFEAESLDEAEYLLLEAQEYNVSNTGLKKLFCGIEVLPNTETETSQIYTLDQWFDSNKTIVKRTEDK